MVDWSEQLGVDSHEPCQPLRVQTIIFPTAGTDQLYLPGIGHDHFVTKRTQHSTHPRRVRANFYGDSTPGHRTKDLSHRFLVRPNAAFLNHLASAI